MTVAVHLTSKCTIIDQYSQESLALPHKTPKHCTHRFGARILAEQPVIY